MCVLGSGSKNSVPYDLHWRVETRDMNLGFLRREPPKHPKTFVNCEKAGVIQTITNFTNYH